MARKSGAIRGKSTTKTKFKKAVKQIKTLLEKKNSTKGKGMSPGAMGGRTKPKLPSQFLRRRTKLSGGKLGSLMSEGMSKGVATNAMKKAAMAAGKGSGKSLSRAGIKGMNKALFTEARKLKTSGRLNMSDIKRTKEMLKNRKGK